MTHTYIHTHIYLQCQLDYLDSLYASEGICEGGSRKVSMLTLNVDISILWRGSTD